MTEASNGGKLRLADDLEDAGMRNASLLRHGSRLIGAFGEIVA